MGQAAAEGQAQAHAGGAVGRFVDRLGERLEELAASRQRDSRAVIADGDLHSLRLGRHRQVQPRVGGGDLLIGGLGADRLTGNAGDDLLLAAMTSFDDDQTALSAIMAELTRTDQTYVERVNHLRSGGGLNGLVVLVADAPGRTVFDDDDADTRSGSSGRDWFFANFEGQGIQDLLISLDDDESTDDL